MDRLRRLLARIEEHPWAGPVVDVVRRMATGFKEDRVTGLAAEIAYFTLLSLFPLLLVLAALLAGLDNIVGARLADRAEDAIVKGLSDVLTSEGDGLVEAVEQLFSRPSPALLSFGIIFTLWAASRTFVAVVNALDAVFELEDRRPWLKVRLLGLGLTVGTLVMAVVLLGLVLIGPLFGSGKELADDLGLGRGFATAWSTLRIPVAVGVMVVWAATVFHLAPHHAHRSRWRDDLPGAVLAALVAGLVTVGFRIYLGLAGSANVVVGAVGGVLTAVLWIYLMAIALLLGAELNDALAQRNGLRKSDRPAVRAREEAVSRRSHPTGKGASPDGEEPGAADAGSGAGAGGDDDPTDGEVAAVPSGPTGRDAASD